MAQEEPFDPKSFFFKVKRVPTERELAEVQQELEEDWAKQREFVQSLEKRPVAARFLASIFESDEFQRAAQQAFGRPITPLERTLRTVFNEEPPSVERGFIVYKTYASDEYLVTKVIEGEPERFSAAALVVNRWDLFELMRVHFEPSLSLDETRQGKRAPLIPSVIDPEIALSGDLAVLIGLRQDEGRKIAGVDLRPLMIVLRQVGHKQMMLIAQEKDRLHTYQELGTLNTRIEELIQKGTNDQELQEMVRHANFNLWVTPFKEKYNEDDLRELERFAFEPMDWVN